MEFGKSLSKGRPLYYGILVALVLSVQKIEAQALGLEDKYPNQIHQGFRWARKPLEAISYFEGSVENSENDDYNDENIWLGQSDFEGLFEEEGVIDDRSFVSSEYDGNTILDPNDAVIAENAITYVEDLLHDEFDSNNPDVIQEAAPDLKSGDTAGVYNHMINGKNRAPDLFDSNNPDVIVREKTASADTDDNIIKKVLPSFEETPMPKKLSLRQWRRTHKDKKIFKEARTAELTSSLYLMPQAKDYQDGKSYVAACLVIRDDHDSVIEWINHHLSLGIRPIYVYDHLSLPPLDTILKRYIIDGRIVYERIDLLSQTNGLSPQLFSYNKCLTDHGGKHKWLAFLDVDEFLMFRNGQPVQSLPAFLTAYESFSALAVHWILFGSSEHDSKPLQSVLRSYIKCMPLNHGQHLFVKSIVNTGCTVGTTDSPHSFKHNCSSPSVRTNMSPIDGATADDLPVHDTLVIHHYATKSLEDFELKVLKGSGMRRQRGWDYFFFVDGWSTEFNFDGLKVWNSDVITKTRVLDPETLQQQIQGYSKEVLEDFWGNSRTTKEDVLDYFDQADEYIDSQKSTNKAEIDDDAEEGEW